MKYSDKLEIGGRTYVIEGGSAEMSNSVRAGGDAADTVAEVLGTAGITGTDPTSTDLTGTGAAGRCELTVRGGDAHQGGVEVRVVAPASELALLGEIVQRSLAGLAHLAGGTAPTPAGQRFRTRVAEDRRRYPKAWSAWGPDEDERLLDGYRSGTTVEQLAAELGRKPRAVVSRLIKHGVVAGEDS